MKQEHRCPNRLDLNPTLPFAFVAALSCCALVAVGCPESPKKTPPIAKIPKRLRPPTVKKSAPPAEVAKPRFGNGVLPPRVVALAKSGSKPMQAFIAKAKTQTGVEAAKTWVDAGALAEKAREFPSALDLYQLAQQAAPKHCDGHTRARKLVAEIGKPEVALLILTTEMQCDGADKTALKAEADRLQESLVVDDHAHKGKKTGAPKSGAPKKPPVH